QACAWAVGHKGSWLSVFSKAGRYFNLIKTKLYVDYLGKMSIKRVAMNVYFLIINRNLRRSRGGDYSVPSCLA
ncbi:hypothetical protein, partial [Methylobacter psychrophilus]|uniref:hypothetical protein n=1 Tax=Methylobacter psychrophilus TaxID=96941 RepID=UPI0021D4ED73